MKYPAIVRLWCLTMILLGAPSAVPLPAWGQAAAPTGMGGGVVQQQSKPLWIEAAVVVLLCGGAVFCVCRGTRRL